jgi:hypothetical protein
VLGKRVAPTTSGLLWGSAQTRFCSAEDGAKRRPQADVGGADALDLLEANSAGLLGSAV